jgi:hypothetical protein
MAAKAKPNTITVTAAVSLYEGGNTYKPGETLEVTPERAAALGDAVTGAPAADAE